MPDGASHRPTLPPKWWLRLLPLTDRSPRWGQVASERDLVRLAEMIGENGLISYALGDGPSAHRARAGADPAIKPNSADQGQHFFGDYPQPVVVIEIHPLHHDLLDADPLERLDLLDALGR